MYMYFFFQLFSKPGKIIIFEYNYNYIIQCLHVLLLFFFLVVVIYYCQIGNIARRLQKKKKVAPKAIGRGP